MKKNILVSVDRGETRVAVLEAKGAATGGKKGKRKKAAPGDEWKVAELYVERRGRRSIVGNIYKGKVDNVLPGMEAAFVDFGLERNGFLHVDEIVTPDGKAAPKRGRGRGRSIAELLKPGQEIMVQVVKDPLKTKGARLSMQLSIAGRYLVYMPQGGGIGVSKRLPDAERQRLRKLIEKVDIGGGGVIVRTAAQGGEEGGLRARDRVPAPPQRGGRAARQEGRGRRDDLPGGRPLDPRRPRRPRRGVRGRDHRRPQAARARHQVPAAHRSRAGRQRRALQGRRRRCSRSGTSRRRSTRCSAAASTCPRAAT